MKLTIPPIVIVLFCILHAHSQTSSLEKEYHIWFDAQVGIENTSLFNGAEYIEGYKTTRNQHKFFIDQTLYSGEVSYDGQVYYNINLKFDIYEDELIASLENKNKKTLLQLIKNKVDYFIIKDHHFIRIDNPEAIAKDVDGFHEIVAKYDLGILYKKHKKRRVKKEDKRIVYFEFYDTKSEFVFRYNDDYYKTTTKNDIYTLFPSIKKELKEFLSNNAVLRRAPKEQQFKALLNKANQLENERKTKN
ncbi:MAG: hypothetical protein K0U54_00230 [Bacteroidetes bacterium]|nr:hypothetical protein [Bacteroidota bacterium]